MIRLAIAAGGAAGREVHWAGAGDGAMEIILHDRSREERFVDADPQATVAALAAGFAGGGARVWIEGAEEPLDPAAALAAAGVTERCHVHVSACEAIAVDVRYAGETGAHRVSPAITVGALLERVARADGGFGLTDTERALHVLALSREGDELDWAEHVGSVAGEDCAVLLDLRPKERFQGE